MVATSQGEALGINLEPEFTRANLIMKSAAKSGVPTHSFPTLLSVMRIQTMVLRLVISHLSYGLPASTSTEGTTWLPVRVN